MAAEPPAGTLPRERAQAWGRAGEWGAALACAGRALAEAPTDAVLHHELASHAAKLGLVDRALSHFRIAALSVRGIAPLLSLATFAPAAPGTDLDGILAIRRRAARALADLHPAVAALPPARRRHPTGRLRIGYLSAHFSRAPYMRPVWGVVNHHDRSAVDVHLFADGGEPPFPGYAPHARDRVTVTASMDVETLHEHLRRAGLDVLVDLSGYGAPTRAGVFLSAAAPVTVAWFNAFATSGLPGLRFQLGDAVVCPRAEDRHYSERVLRLPRSYLAFSATTPMPEVAPSPAARGRPFTLGCLAPLYKLTDPTLDDWCALLRAVPEARLLLAHGDAAGASNREHLLRRLEARGVARQRVRLAGPAPNPEFVRHYDDIDLALDTRPYSGGTTTGEALWQGVPVLTWRGDRWAARTSASQLASAGLHDFVAADGEDFVRRGTALAGAAGRTRLREMRPHLRQQLRRSAACAVARQARDFERLFARLVRAST